MVPPTSGVSLTGASAVLASAGVNVSVKTLSRNLEKECQKHTPYGYLITSLDLPLDGGGSYSWKICNPFALLYLLLSQSSAFEALAREHLRGTNAKISLYADEASAGNVLHPKLPRKTQCVYWSISSFPMWFHSRAYAWLPFGYLRPKSWAASGVRPRLLSLSLSFFPSLSRSLSLCLSVCLSVSLSISLSLSLSLFRHPSPLFFLFSPLPSLLSPL